TAYEIFTYWSSDVCSSDLELRLEVRLVEAGEHLLRVGRLELAVEVDLLVHRVDRPVQALPARGVGEVGVDHEHVVGGQAGQRQRSEERRVGKEGRARMAAS